MATKETITKTVTKTVDVEEKVTALVLTDDEANVLAALGYWNVSVPEALFKDDYVARSLESKGITQDRIGDILGGVYNALGYDAMKKAA